MSFVGRSSFAEPREGHASSGAGALDGASEIDVRRLNAIALGGLSQMFNREAQLFCHTLKRGKSGLSQEGISPRYTILTLLGLYRLETAGVCSPVPITRIFESVLERCDWVKSIGDIGLMLWVSALACPQYLEQVVTRFNVKQALERDQKRYTLDIALFLTGLAHHALAEVGRLCDLTDAAVKAFQILKQGQGEPGLFGHCAARTSLGAIVRGRIGSFADQSQSIYALAKAAQAFSLDKAAAAALDCALTVCELQGPLGQWWWHYDACTGRVVDRYPVFSVHQAATAPMALLELGETLQSDFTPWIVKGLEWVTGTNELEEDMCDSSANIIWGRIQRDRFNRVVRAATSFLTRLEDLALCERLSIRYECQPYHHGLILYAFGQSGVA